PDSPVPAPSPYTARTKSFTERREPESRPASLVRAIRTGHRVPRPRPPPVPGTHAMALRPSFVPLRVPLLPPPESSLRAVPDPESDLDRAASPTVSRLLTTVVTDPSFESTAAPALVAELVDFAAACHLDYATSLVAESESASPPSVEDSHGCRDGILEVHRHLRRRSSPSGANIVDGMWIFRVKRPSGSPPSCKARYAARGFSQRQEIEYFHTFSPTPKMTTLWLLLHVAAQRDYELHSLDFSTAFLHFAAAVLRPHVCQRPGLCHCTEALALVKLELQKRHTCTDLGEPRNYLGLQITWDRARHTITLTQSHMVHQVLQRFVFRYSSPQSTPLPTAHSLSAPPLDESVEPSGPSDLGELRHYLGLQITRDRAARTITLPLSHVVQQVLQRFELQHFTVQRPPLAVDHGLTGPFPDEPFEPSGPYAEILGCLMYLMTCTRPDLAFPLSILACFVAPRRHRPVHWTAAVRVAKYLATTSGVGMILGGRQDVVLTGHCDSSYADDAETHRSTQGYCFSLGSGAVSWWSTRSSSVLTSTAEAEIYAGAMAAQELRWLTFLLTDLSERPSSAPTLFTDNKATILLCREPRLESRVKHINVRYFLLRELQRRGQARFDFLESEANTVDIFAKALPPSMSVECPVPGELPGDEVVDSRADGGITAGGADGKDGARSATAGSRKTSLSSRGARALVPFSPYINAVNKAKEEPYSEKSPDGYFLMAQAETVLTFDLIHEKIKSCREVPSTIGLYGNFRGGQRLRQAIATMMQRTFMGVDVDPLHICISSGVTAVLDLFFFATCSAGEGCFIPAPYFPAFDNDMSIRVGG
ncbi:unnamed protein product, partial [Closterium sp. NIES-54]